MGFVLIISSQRQTESQDRRGLRRLPPPLPAGRALTEGYLTKNSPRAPHGEYHSRGDKGLSLLLALPDNFDTQLKQGEAALSTDPDGAVGCLLLPLPPPAPR